MQEDETAGEGAAECSQSVSPAANIQLPTQENLRGLKEKWRQRSQAAPAATSFAAPTAISQAAPAATSFAAPTATSQAAPTATSFAASTAIAGELVLQRCCCIHCIH